MGFIHQISPIPLANTHQPSICTVILLPRMKTGKQMTRSDVDKASLELRTVDAPSQYSASACVLTS